MFHSIGSECIGCGACKRACPTGAVTGEIKELHIINETLCINCGACGRVCPKSAVRNQLGQVVPKLKKSLWTKPEIITEKCYACENCVAACPTGALSMKDEHLPLQENTAVLSSPEKCVSCRWCVENCQFDAIAWETPVQTSKDPRK